MMCGIAGIWNLNNQSIEMDSLRQFTDTMEHRGPDGSGYELHSNSTLGLGHRRLSILDTSEAGKQPFTYLDRYSMTYNGEVYNFLEIKNELISKGYSFRTETDTEVVIAAYHEYGKKCLEKFNGMWAFAIWDKKERSLFLSRDRYGIKPLHYIYKPGKVFAFASETIAFKKLNGFTRSFNESNMILALQNSGYIEASGKTIFKEIEQLLPGHTITISEDKKVKIDRWWNTADYLFQINQDYKKQVEEFRELFYNACQLRMRSDVSLASALSGGLDSSSVYCTLQQFKENASELYRLPQNWQKAFVATFPNTAMDERQYAEEVIKHTKGEVVYITPNYSNLVEEITTTTKLFDGIIANPLIAISSIYKAMRENKITVSLDGHGVDEYAFGYNHYALQGFYHALNTGNENLAKELALITDGLAPNYSYEKLMTSFYAANSFSSNIKRKLKSIIGYRTNAQGIKKEYYWFPYEVKMDDLNFFTNPFSGIDKALFNDFHYQSLPINLRDFDRASMQNSVEIRMPFMDYRLVNYMFSLPQQSKLGNGYTKRIVRDAMKNIIPDIIRNRTLKIGIGSPIAEWMEGSLKEMVLDMVSSNKLKNANYCKGRKIQIDVENLYKNKSWNTQNASQTWSVLNALIIDE